MLYSLLQIIFCIQAVASDNTDKYKEAVKVSVHAAYIQTGLESQFLNVKHVASNRAKEWMKRNGMSTLLTVGSVVVPVLYYKRIEFHTGNFSGSITKDKKSLDFIVGF